MSTFSVSGETGPSHSSIISGNTGSGATYNQGQTVPQSNLSLCTIISKSLICGWIFSLAYVLDVSSDLISRDHVTKTLFSTQMRYHQNCFTLVHLVQVKPYRIWLENKIFMAWSCIVRLLETSCVDAQITNNCTILRLKWLHNIVHLFSFASSL